MIRLLPTLKLHIFVDLFIVYTIASTILLTSANPGWSLIPTAFFSILFYLISLIFVGVLAYNRHKTLDEKVIEIKSAVTLAIPALVAQLLLWLSMTGDCGDVYPCDAKPIIWRIADAWGIAGAPSLEWISLWLSYLTIPFVVTYAAFLFLFLYKIFTEKATARATLVTLITIAALSTIIVFQSYPEFYVKFANLQAQKNSDAESCIRLANEEEFHCLRSLISSSSGNLSLCPTDPSTGRLYDACYLGFLDSGATVSLKICGAVEQTGYGFAQSDCYRRLALQTQNETLCEKMKNDNSNADTIRDKDNCYYLLAEEKNDIALCEKIHFTSRQQDCYANFTSLGE